MEFGNPISGIKYYKTPESCISQYEKKPWTEKALSLISSFGTLFMYVIDRIRLIISRSENKMDPYSKDPVSTSKKLVVCLHGLNNNPTQFHSLLDEINNENHSKISVYIPKIRMKGNDQLDEMVKPILQNIAIWAATGEDKELVLVGISNGGRIARALEAELINTGKLGQIKRLHFVSIVGACKGSSLATLAKKVHASWILSKNIAEEMPTDSERFKQLEKDWGQARKVEGLEKEYTFLASPHDWQVPNYSSTLMEVPGENARYAIVPNHGHNSIVHAVAKSVAKIVSS